MKSSVFGSAAVIVTIGLFALAGGCTKTEGEGGAASSGAADKKPTDGEPDKAAAAKKPVGKSVVDESGVELKTISKDKRPEPELLPEPRERRLHPDTATASSFLWNDWNKFQENYHPLYLIDDDPKTAWVEGAKGHGHGEWIELKTSKVNAVTKVRLRLRNGYHKSKSLFGKNSRAKNLKVTLLPSKVEKSFDLEDSMDWAELALEQPDGVLEKIRLEVVATYPGSKWEDLCLSDLEIFATARNIENPEFEKSKLARVLAWKKERVDTATFFASQKAKSSMLLGGYKVLVDDEASGEDTGIELPPSKRTAEQTKIVERGEAALKEGFKGWTNVKLTLKNKSRIPAVDGINLADPYFQISDDYPDYLNGFPMPWPGKAAFLLSTLLVATPAAKPVTLAAAVAGEPQRCVVRGRARHYYYVPPRKDTDPPGITQLLVIACGLIEEREGYYVRNTGRQLLSYDDKGRLVAIITDNSADTYTWSEGASPKIIYGENEETRLLARKK